MVAEHKPRKSLPVYITPSELHRLLGACQHDRDRRLIEFLWQTGARISEVLDVRAGDLTKSGVRLPNLKQTVMRKDAEGNRRRVSVQAEKHVILHPEYLARLHAWTEGLDPTMLLFGRLEDHKRMTRKRAWEIVKGAAARAGIARRRYGEDQLASVWPHTLRHSYAVHLLDNQVPVTVVSEQLGHSSLASTQIYTRLSNARTAELIAGISF